MPSSPDNACDADLVRAVFAGDREAYGRFVDRYLPAVYATAVRILGQREDAEDIAQDTFLRAFQRLSLYDPEQPFRHWLLKIAANLALNRLRAKRRERNLQQKAIEQRRDRSAAGPPAEVDARRWQYWLSRLDETQRTAIVLFHFEQMSYTEIAEVLDVPLNTVRTYLHRGRKRLCDLMSQPDERENEPWTAANPND